jgi:hypothetical protein
MSAFKNPSTESVEHGLHDCDGFVQHLNLEPPRQLGLDTGECLWCLPGDLFEEVVDVMFSRGQYISRTFGTFVMEGAAKRCAALASKCGAGFVLRAEVIASLKKHQSLY